MCANQTLETLSQSFEMSSTSNIHIQTLYIIYWSWLFPKLYHDSNLGTTNQFCFQTEEDMIYNNLDQLDQSELIKCTQYDFYSFLIYLSLPKINQFLILSSIFALFSKILNFIIHNLKFINCICETINKNSMPNTQVKSDVSRPDESLPHDLEQPRCQYNW